MTEPDSAENAEKTPEEIAAMVARLTKQEVRILGLMSLGWSDAHIALHIAVSPNTISTHINRVKKKLKLQGRGREPLALIYVTHVLPTDLLPRYSAPGQKLEEWRQRARQIRAELRAAGLLSPEHVEAAMLLANPDYIGMRDADLAALMTGGFFRAYITVLTDKIRGGRCKLVVVATLAPFDKEDELL